jgi:hypothetical protein
MGWISPTGYVDPDNVWDWEAYIYDGDTESSGACEVDAYSWSSFIQLTHASMSCSKVRFWVYVYQDPAYINAVDIDAYYNNTWNHVYEGETSVYGAWVEKELASSQTITAVRLRFYNAFKRNLYYMELSEVELYEEVAISVTTQAATQIAYQCAIGNGTITSGTNATERGFEIVVEFSGTLCDYFNHLTAGFVGDSTWDIVLKWNGTLTKTETEEGDFAEGIYELVLGYPSASYDVWGTPDYSFDDKLFKCESYTYRARATIGGVVYYGDYVAFDTLCDSGEEQQPTDDISEGNPVEPIIPIEIPPEEITPIEIPPYGYPPFEWIPPEEIPYPPWDWTLPPWEMPDYPSLSFVGDFYYKKPYTKKDLDELREKCIIYNKNSVELALVLRHNMNVLKEFFNMMTDYLGKEEFNDFTDLIPPQNLKQLYLDPLGVNDFKDMINGFIRNSIDNNMAVNRNFKLIEEGLVDYETGSEDAYFKEINTSTKSINEDDPDVERLKRVIDNLNEDTSSNYDNITYNLEVIRARLL